MLFKPGDIPLIQPQRDPMAPALPGETRKVWVAVYNPIPGAERWAIQQVTACSETEAHLQHTFWPGHDHMEVEEGVNPNMHEIEAATGRIVAKDRTEELAAEAAAVARNLKAHKITGGFESNALGSDHEYPSNPNDQTNMMTTAMVGGLLMCADGEGVWELRKHTPTQAAQVLADFVAHRDAARTGS